jgi:hypothetical protein
MVDGAQAGADASIRQGGVVFDQVRDGQFRIHRSRVADRMDAVVLEKHLSRRDGLLLTIFVEEIDASRDDVAPCSPILLGRQQEWRKKYTDNGCFHIFSLLLFHYEAPLGAAAAPVLLDNFENQHSRLYG